MQPLFGRLALEAGYITPEQLAEATHLQARLGDGRLLGQVLVELGYLDFEQLNELLTAQRSVKGERPPLPKASDLSGESVVARIRPVRRAVEPEPLALTAGLDETRREIPSRARADDEGALPRLVVDVATRRNTGSFSGLCDEPRRSDEPKRDPELVLPQLLPRAIGRWSALSELTETLRSPVLRGCWRDARALGASDLHLQPGAAPQLRLASGLTSLGKAVIEPGALEPLVAQLTDAARVHLEAEGHVTVASLLDAQPVRCALTRTAAGLEMTVRLWAEPHPTLSRLGLPQALARLTNAEQGLVLVTGPRSSGKTSVINALARVVADERAVHMVCLETPVELSLHGARALVTHLEPAPHERVERLRQALTLSAEVLVVPDASLELIPQLLSAADSGRLILAGVQATGLPDAYTRWLDSLGADERAWGRSRLADALVGCLNIRRLVAASGEGSLPAFGLVMNARPIAALLREDKLAHLEAVLESSGPALGSSLDEQLERMVRGGLISRREARSHALEPGRFTERGQN